MKGGKTTSLITDFTNMASQKWNKVNDRVIGGVDRKAIFV